MKIKSFFDDCTSIFDVVSILNNFAREGKLKLFYLPRMDGLELPVTESLMTNEIDEIASVKISPFCTKDDDLQEVLFIDKQDGKYWAATFSTYLEGYESNILSNGVKFTSYEYDIDCLDDELNKDYVKRIKGEEYILKADIFAMVID